MFVPMLFMVISLLIIFFIFDTYLYKKEKIKKVDSDIKIGIEGSFNLLLLLGVIGSVLLSGFWKPHIEFEVFYVHVELQNIIREILLLFLLQSFLLSPY